MLETQHVGLRIGGNRILHDLSLAVTPGEVVAVVGPNGAGKSTLLKALCGDLQPTDGRVLLDNKPLSAWDRRALALRRAVLPQNSSLTFAFTALEVALMGRTPHLNSVETPADYAIAREALAAVGMLHLQARVYTTLSGGERQRVQLARVLAQIWEAADDQPRYLLLDEPTTSLDLAHQHGTLQIASRFARQGVGVLTILHDLNLAAQYADQIIVPIRHVCSSRHAQGRLDRTPDSRCLRDAGADYTASSVRLPLNHPIKFVRSSSARSVKHDRRV